MRALNDRRTSHLAQVDVAEELQDCQFADARILVARAVEDVVQHLDHLIHHKRRVNDMNSGSIYP